MLKERPLTLFTGPTLGDVTAHSYQTCPHPKRVRFFFSAMLEH
jgi:hypothetical protein